MFMIYADNKLIYQPSSEKLQLLSPKLTLEIGKAGSLDFGVPPTHTYYNNFQQLKSVLTVKLDNQEVFRGRVLSNKRNFTNVREIYGEGNLAYLVDSVQKAEKYSGKTGPLFRQLIAAHNNMIKDPEKQFQVGTIDPAFENVDIVLIGKTKDGDDSQSEELSTTSFNYKQIALDSIADEWQNTFDIIETCLIDYLGGYLRTRRNETTGVVYIDWLKDYFSTTSQKIEFGKNLLDLTEEVNAEEVFSVLIPLGDENLTIESVNGGSIELVNPDAVARYGRIVKTNVFDSVTNPSTLLENGRRYLEKYSKITTTITVTAVDLHLLNPNVQSISLGDRVYILSPAHNIDSRELTCTKIEYDLANPANTVYTFGNPQQTLTERYRKDKQDRRSSRGSSSAAAVAQQLDENQTDFYDAWVKVEADKGHIDLGTLFKRVHGDQTQLAGGTLITLDSNPEHSAIDIWADHAQWEDDRAKLKYMAGINLDTTDTSARVDIYAMDKITQKTARFLQSVQYNEATGKSEAITQLQSDIFNVDAKVTNISGILNAIDINADRSITVKKTLSATTAFITKLRANDIKMIRNNGTFWDLGNHRHSVEINGTRYETSSPY